MSTVTEGALLSRVLPMQICLLVPDIEEAMLSWSALLGRTDWRLHTYSSEWVPRWIYRGEPGRFSMKLAMIGESPQIELIQPLEGPSIYHEWVQEHGYGPHHIGFIVPSIDELVDEAVAEGIDVMQYGSGYGIRGDGGFAYLDTVAKWGVILEAIEVPVERVPSEPLPDAVATLQARMQEHREASHHHVGE